MQGKWCGAACTVCNPLFSRGDSIRSVCLSRRACRCGPVPCRRAHDCCGVVVQTHILPLFTLPTFQCGPCDAGSAAALGWYSYGRTLGAFAHYSVLFSAFCDLVDVRPNADRYASTAITIWDARALGHTLTLALTYTKLAPLFFTCGGRTCLSSACVKGHGVSIGNTFAGLCGEDHNGDLGSSIFYQVTSVLRDEYVSLCLLRAATFSSEMFQTDS